MHKSIRLSRACGFKSQAFLQWLLAWQCNLRPPVFLLQGLVSVQKFCTLVQWTASLRHTVGLYHRSQNASLMLLSSSMTTVNNCLLADAPVVMQSSRRSWIFLDRNHELGRLAVFKLKPWFYVKTNLNWNRGILALWTRFETASQLH